MRAAMICLVSGAALLAACSPKDKRTQEAEPAAAAASVAAPARKAGLWEITTASTGRDGEPRTMTSQMCLDAATDKLAPFVGRQSGRGGDCQQTVIKAGSGYAFASSCTRGERTITTHGLATGDFNSTYKVDVSTKTDPPRADGPVERLSTVSGKWLGVCKAGQKAGDVTLGNGTTYNLVDGPPRGMRGAEGRGRGVADENGPSAQSSAE